MKCVLKIVFSLLFQDGLDALVYDLDFPALRKNKNIDTFLNKCKCFGCVIDSLVNFFHYFKL